MNKSSILVCPNDKLLQPESIKAFSESRKDRWKLLLIGHHPELKVKIDNLYQTYIDGNPVRNPYTDYVKQVESTAHLYGATQPIWVSINDWLVELEWIVEEQLHDTEAYIYDQMMAYNTLISSLLPMAVIPQLVWMDARDYIRTNDEFGNPALREKIEWPPMDKEIWYISQANLGSTPENNSTHVAEAGEEVLWLREA